MENKIIAKELIGIASELKKKRVATIGEKLANFNKYGGTLAITINDEIVAVGGLIRAADILEDSILRLRKQLKSGQVAASTLLYFKSTVFRKPVVSLSLINFNDSVTEQDFYNAAASLGYKKR